MRDRVGARAVFRTAADTFGLSGIFKRNVMNFMPAMKVAEHFEGPNLTALRGGVEEMRIDPQDLHTERRCHTGRGPSQRASPTGCARRGRGRDAGNGRNGAGTATGLPFLISAMAHRWKDTQRPANI